MLRELLTDARLADAGFARQQHRLALAIPRELPAIDKQRHFAVAADQAAEHAAMLGLEATRDVALRDDAPGFDGLGEALQLHQAERAQFEGAAQQAPSLFRDDD